MTFGNLGVNFRFVPNLAALLLQVRSRSKTPFAGGQSGVSARAARQIMICIRFIAPCAPPGAQEHKCGKDHQELSGETFKGGLGGSRVEEIHCLLLAGESCAARLPCWS